MDNKDYQSSVDCTYEEAKRKSRHSFTQIFGQMPSQLKRNLSAPRLYKLVLKQIKEIDRAGLLAIYHDPTAKAITIYLLMRWLSADPKAKQSLHDFVKNPYNAQETGQQDTVFASEKIPLSRNYSAIRNNQEKEYARQREGLLSPDEIAARIERSRQEAQKKLLASYLTLCGASKGLEGVGIQTFLKLAFPLQNENIDILPYDKEKILKACKEYNLSFSKIADAKTPREFVIRFLAYYQFEYTYRFNFMQKAALRILSCLDNKSDANSQIKKYTDDFLPFIACYTAPIPNHMLASSYVLFRFGKNKHDTIYNSDCDIGHKIKAFEKDNELYPLAIPSLFMLHDNDLLLHIEKIIKYSNNDKTRESKLQELEVQLFQLRLLTGIVSQLFEPLLHYDLPSWNDEIFKGAETFLIKNCNAIEYLNNINLYDDIKSLNAEEAQIHKTRGRKNKNSLKLRTKYDLFPQLVNQLYIDVGLNSK